MSFVTTVETSLREAARSVFARCQYGPGSPWHASTRIRSFRLSSLHIDDIIIFCTLRLVIDGSARLLQIPAHRSRRNGAGSVEDFLCLLPPSDQVPRRRRPGRRRLPEPLAVVFRLRDDRKDIIEGGEVSGASALPFLDPHVHLPFLEERLPIIRHVIDARLGLGARQMPDELGVIV